MKKQHPRLRNALVLTLVSMTFSFSTSATERLESSANASAIFLRYRGVFDGPAPLHPARLRPDAFGEVSERDPVQVRNTVALGKIQTDSPELSEISAALTWKLQPLATQHAAELSDPYVRYAQTQALALDQGFLGFDLRAYAPLSTESRANRLRVGLESHPTLFYAFAQSRWSLESNAGLRVNFCGSPTADADFQPLPQWELHLSPGATYALSPRWEFIQALHFGVMNFVESVERSRSQFSEGARLENLGTVFEPGFRFQSTVWRVRPYLSVPLLPTLSPRNWTFGAEVSAVLF